MKPSAFHSDVQYAMFACSVNIDVTMTENNNELRYHRDYLPNTPIWYTCKRYIMIVSTQALTLFFQYVNIRYQLGNIFLREAGKRMHHRGVSVLPNSNAVLSRSNYVLKWLYSNLNHGRWTYYLLGVRYMMQFIHYYQVIRLNYSINIYFQENIVIIVYYI